MGYEAILFDMDGVIVDTYQSVTKFWQNIAKAKCILRKLISISTCTDVQQLIPLIFYSPT